MQTFDQALLRHHQAGRVSMEDALRVATSPHDFKLLVAAEGRTSTSMDDVAESTPPSVKAGPSRFSGPDHRSLPGVSARSGSSPPPGVAA